jgi:hypothetical protein
MQKGGQFMTDQFSTAIGLDTLIEKYHQSGMSMRQFAKHGMTVQ